MKIHVLSDLHLEFGPFDPPRVESDVVVLAGDINLGTKGVEWAIETFSPKPVIYVPGNHEYYKQAIPRLTEKMKVAAEGSSVHVLDQDAVEVDGVRFLGCTLWTDFNLYGDPVLAGATAHTRMMDYSVIRVSPRFRKLRPEDTVRWHHYARKWLSEHCESAQKTVVVTHHAPSPRSIEPRFEGDVVNAAYASDLEDLIDRMHPALWIHGHTHAPFDYKVGQTRVLCNPRGYSDEPTWTFKPSLVAEI